MSKTFYPIIDEAACTECGLCLNECDYGVYDEKKAPMPVVINPDACRPGCAKCKPTCPVDAMTYNNEEKDKGGCGGRCGDDCACEDGCGDDCDCGGDTE